MGAFRRMPDGMGRLSPRDHRGFGAIEARVCGRACVWCCVCVGVWRVRALPRAGGRVEARLP